MCIFSSLGVSLWTDRCPANAPLLCIQGRWGPTPVAIISPVFPHAGWPEWPPQPENPFDPFILPEPPSFPNTSTFPAWLSDDVQAKLAGSPIKTLASEVPSVTKKKTSADSTIKVNRRNTQTRRTTEDRRKKDVEVPVERRQSDRRKVQRRRQIDPTTCERDYTNDEIEFMHALDEYKRSKPRLSQGFQYCSARRVADERLRRIWDFPTLFARNWRRTGLVRFSCRVSVQDGILYGQIGKLSTLVIATRIWR